jgi:hypothetical protein
MTEMEHSIQIDYALSKSEVYMHTAQALLLHSAVPLMFLTAVESPDRKISSTHELPSWVPDWTTRQTVATVAIQEWYIQFSADRGTLEGYTVLREWYSKIMAQQQFPSRHTSGIPKAPKTLPLLGTYLAVVTRTSVANLIQASYKDKIKLIEYDKDPSKWRKTFNRSQRTLDKEVESKSMMVTNSSWGPWWAEVGDIIVVLIYS